MQRGARTMLQDSLARRGGKGSEGHGMQFFIARSLIGNNFLE
jgi:hypothetical protein